MAQKFQTKFVERSVRFDAGEFTADMMLKMATALRDSVRARILRAQNVNDQAARPLVPSYRKWKTRNNRFFGLRGVRDWYRSGETIRALQVLEARPNLAIVGFSTPMADRRAFFNNRRERQFGVSPRDRMVIQMAFDAARMIKAEAS